MSIITTPRNGGSPAAEAPPPGQQPADEAAVATLQTMQHQLDHQERRISRALSAYGIFAGLALLIAMANLIAVAIKLGKKDTARPVAAAAVAPATAATPAPVAVHRIGVTLKEFRLIPTSTQAAQGPVTFTVHNTGKLTHEFVVVKTNTPAASLPPTNGRADETGNIGETGEVPAGATKRVTIKLPPGHYALICNLPGHYQAGQHQDLTVR